MLHSLRQRELGVDPPWVLTRAFDVLHTYSLELSTVKQIRAEHTAPIVALDVDPVDGQFLLSASSDTSVSMYNTWVRTRAGAANFIKPMCRVGKREGGHAFAVTDVQWYPFDTGMFVTASSDRQVFVWDTNALAVVCSFQLSGHVHAARMSRIATHHTLVATGSTDSRVRLCDIATGGFTHTLVGHKQAVWTVEWSPRNEFLLLTGAADGTVRVWDIRSAAGCLMSLNQHASRGATAARAGARAPRAIEHGRRRHAFQHHSVDGLARAHDAAVTAIAFTPDGESIVTSDAAHNVHLWDAVTAQPRHVHYVRAHGRRTRPARLAIPRTAEVMYLPAGRHAHVYEVRSGELVGRLAGHFDTLHCCVWNDAAGELYTAGSDRLLLVHQPHGGVWGGDTRAAGGAHGCAAPAGHTGDEAGDVDAWSDDESE